MLKNSEHVHEFFEKHPYATYEFIQILDIQLHEPPYCYIAIFRNIHTNRNENVLIPPELLRVKYRIGYYYKAGKKININKFLRKEWIDLKVSYDTKIERNATIFGDESKILIDGLNQYNNHYFYKQSSIVYEFENYLLVIPCSAIALRFYFLSSSMKNAVMNGSLDDLYYDKPLYENDEVHILIKKRANKKDLPFLCRFLINKEAMQKFKYFYNQRHTISQSLYPIRSHFPVSGEFRILVTYTSLATTINGKPVFYVHNIINDDSALGFSKIFYKQIVAKEDPSKVPSQEQRVGKPRKFSRNKFPKDKTIRPGTPSSENSLEIIFEIAERDANTRNLNVNGENIYMPGPENPTPIDKKDEKKGSQSFSPPAPNGNKSLSTTALVEVPEDKLKKPFMLVDFIVFYDALMECTSVEELEHISLEIVPQVNNKVRNTLKVFSTNHDTNQARNYLFSIFAYDNRCVYLVEFEQDAAWGPSTWFFASMDDSSTNYAIDTIEEIITYYFETEKVTYSMLEEKVQQDYQLAFIKHNHKRDKVDSIEIDIWCENLLEKIQAITL